MALGSALAVALAAPSPIFAESAEVPASAPASSESGLAGAMVKEKPLAAVHADTAGYRKFRFGGYGEMLASWKNYGINRFDGTSGGSTRTHRATIAIPRFVLAFDYKFNKNWILGAEIEFEAGGVGTAVELENSENGEYETEIEKGGEVALEQFHITRLILPALNVRVGQIILPIGLTNAHHEPINFFGTFRPESETKLMPSTWHETGIEIFGSFGRRFTRFDYQVMVVAGLNANGFDRNEWIIGGKSGIFETDNFTSPAYVGRLDYSGVPGLRTGVSFYYCNNVGANSDKPQTYKGIGKIPVAIGTWDATYRNRFLTARANVTYGYVGNSAALSDANRKLSNKSPYSRLVPIARNALSYGAEVGFNIAGVAGKRCPALTPFVRYEYYNPQYKGEKGQTMDKRLEVSQWQAGLNWFALPNLVVKADYTHRAIGTSAIFGRGVYNPENEFSIGVAYIGWFFKK